MKCREIALFCGLLLLFALTGVQTGCAAKTEPQQTPLPTAKLTPVPKDGGMLFANTSAADQLAPILAARMEAAYGILTTSLVNMDDLDEAPHFGRMLMQQISSRLSQHGFKMIEARLAGSMIINKQGEFMLSREAGARLAKEYNAYAVLVGLYSRVGNHLYISTRVLRLGDSAVLAAYEYSLPEALIAPGIPAAASAVPVSTAQGVPFSPGAMPSVTAGVATAPAGAVIIPPSMPSAAPKAVSPVAVPVAGGTAEDALWERYSKRGQAFADCEQTAAPPRPVAATAATAPKAAFKSTGKQIARPKAKPTAKQADRPKAKQIARPEVRQPSTMDDLLGATPLCPPGCVPASPMECPPGCVPAKSRNTPPAPGTAQKTAPKTSSPGAGLPVAPSPATTGSAAAGTAPANAPVTVTPSTASAPPPAPSAPSAAPPPAAEPAPPATAPMTPTPAARSAAPTPAAEPTPPTTAPVTVPPAPVPATPAQTATTTADPVDAAPSEASTSVPARDSSAQDGSEPAPAPAAGIPPPAASQLGQFNRDGT